MGNIYHRKHARDLPSGLRMALVASDWNRNLEVIIFVIMIISAIFGWCTVTGRYCSWALSVRFTADT